MRFPGRDDESLAPIFTPPRSVSGSESNVDFPQPQAHHDIPFEGFSPEQTKETFDVARNSIELLSTVLSSSPQQDALKVIFFFYCLEFYCCLLFAIGLSLLDEAVWHIIIDCSYCLALCLRCVFS